MTEVLSFDGEPLVDEPRQPAPPGDLRLLRDTVARAHASALDVHHALQARALAPTGAGTA